MKKQAGSAVPHGRRDVPAFLVGAARSRWVKAAFLALALAAAVWAVASQWPEVREALSSIPPAAVAGGLVLSLVYVGLTMLSWRALMSDLGSLLPLRTASTIFFVSQAGKYLPGGVWNVVAASEMAVEHAVPRRRSVSVMVVSILVSISTGLALATVAVAFSPAEVADRYRWVLVGLPFFVAVLLPPLLNRMLGLALRITRRPPLESPATACGVGVAAGWAVLAWLVAGGQVWLLAAAAGLDPTASSLALTVGGYALAWTVGFLVVVVPAGVGVREVVLGAVLSGYLGAGEVVVVVLLSRVLLTVADLALGIGGAVVGARMRPSHPV